MSDLRKRMLEDLQLGGYSERTVESYVSAVAAFAKYHKKSPAVCGRGEIRSWVLHLQARGLSAASIHLYLSGLIFLYRRTLSKPEMVADFPLPRVKRKPPVVLSRREVYALLEAFETPHMRMFFMLVYAAGLRLREAMRLVFRAKMLAALGLLHDARKFARFAALQDPDGFQALMRTIAAKHWVVYAKKPFRDVGHVLRYLGRYTHRVAIANSRLVEVTEIAPLWWTPGKGLRSPEIHRCSTESHAPIRSRRTPYAA